MKTPIVLSVFGLVDQYSVVILQHLVILGNLLKIAFVVGRDT